MQQGAGPSSLPVRKKETAVSDLVKKAKEKAVLAKPLPVKAKAVSPLIPASQQELPKAAPNRRLPLPKPKAKQEESLISDELGRGRRHAGKLGKFPKAKPVTSGPDSDDESSTPEIQGAVTVLEPGHDNVSVSSPESPPEPDSGEDELVPPDLSGSESPPRRVSARLQERRQRETASAVAKAVPTSSLRTLPSEDKAVVARKAVPSKASFVPNKPKPTVSPSIPVKTATLGKASGAKGGKAGRGRGQAPRAVPEPTANSDEADEAPLSSLPLRQAIPAKAREPTAPQPKQRPEPKQEQEDHRKRQPGQRSAKTKAVPAGSTAMSHVQVVPDFPIVDEPMGDTLAKGIGLATPQLLAAERIASPPILDAPNKIASKGAIEQRPVAPYRPQVALSTGASAISAAQTEAEVDAKEARVSAATQPQKVQALVCTDLEGRLDCLDVVLRDFAAKGIRVDFVLATGDTFPRMQEDAEVFQAFCGDPPSQKLTVPVYFIDSRHAPLIEKASKRPAKQQVVFAEHGGKNMLTFLGACGVVDLSGITIAFLSGRYDKDKFNEVWKAGRFLGCHYTGNAVDEILRQQELCGKERQYVDMLLTSEWMDKYWSTATKSEAATPVSAEHTSPVVRDLFLKLRPRYHVCGSANHYNYRKAEQGPHGFVCTSVGLAKPAVEQPVVSDMSDQKWYKLISIKPGEGLQTVNVASAKAAQVVSKSHTLQRKAAGGSPPVVHLFDNIPSAEPQVQMPLAHVAIGSKRRHDETSELPCKEELPTRQQSHSMHKGSEDRKRQRTEGSKLQVASPEQLPLPSPAEPLRPHDDEDGAGTTSPCYSDAPTLKHLQLEDPLPTAPCAAIVTPPVMPVAEQRPASSRKVTEAQGGDITPPVRAIGPLGTVTPPVSDVQRPHSPAEEAKPAREQQEPSVPSGGLDPLQQASTLLSQFLTRRRESLGEGHSPHEAAPPPPVSKAQAPAVPLALTKYNVDQLEALLSGAAQTQEVVAKTELRVPKGWEVRHSSTYNMDYYYHLATGQSAWEMPIDREEL